MKVKFKDNITAQLTALSDIYVQAARDAYAVFVANTPKLSGNARRNTTLKNGTSPAIDANYPYAGELDAGSSPKSPQGMTKPATKEFEVSISKQVRKRNT
jgi:hypothetical protein